MRVEDAFLERVNSLVDIWKPRLMLGDWRIRVEISTEKKIRALADCLSRPSRRYARIRVAIDGHESHHDPHDLEQIIVHELLHCYWPSERKQSHIGVEAVSWALVNAYRSR